LHAGGEWIFRRPPPQSLDANETYLTFGPHTPLLRLVATSGPTIRPDIPLSEFSTSLRVVRDHDFFAPFAVGDQLSIGIEPWRGADRFYWSKPFCIPDRDWTFLATVAPRSQPDIYEIKSLVPVDRNWQPLPKDAPLPYRCLYGERQAGF
jgi:hypothetical protein